MSKKTKTKAQIIGDACCGILVLVSIIVYLILGMTLNFWHPGWLIPACAAIFCGVISIITNTISELKKADKKDDNIEIK